MDAPTESLLPCSPWVRLYCPPHPLPDPPLFSLQDSSQDPCLQEALLKFPNHWEDLLEDHAEGRGR